jgi:hypothetical protein
MSITFAILAVFLIALSLGTALTRFSGSPEELAPGRIVDADGGMDLDGSGLGTFYREVGGKVVLEEATWGTEGPPRADMW